jgi:hypothetical protein
LTKVIFTDATNLPIYDPEAFSTGVIQGFGHYEHGSNKLVYVVSRSGEYQVVKNDLAVSYTRSSGQADPPYHELSESHAVVGTGGGWDGSFQSVIPAVKEGTAVLVEIDQGVGFDNPHNPKTFVLSGNTVEQLPNNAHIYAQDLSTAYSLNALLNRWEYVFFTESIGDVTLAEVLTDFTTYAGKYTTAQVETENLEGINLKAVYMSQGGSVQDLIKRICALFSVNIVERNGGIAFIRKSAITADLGGGGG